MLSLNWVAAMGMIPFFADHGIQVYALDQSEIVINQIKGENINPRFICEDLLSINENFAYEINHGYARFVLHALNKAEAEKAIAIMSRILPIDGYFFSGDFKVWIY